MDINNFLQSKSFKIAVACISVFIALFLVFSLGVYVGTQKANFSFRWAEQYHKNFAGPKNGFFQEFAGNDFLESNGVFGKIIKVNDGSIIVKGNDDVEKNIIVNEKTTIKNRNQNLEATDLKIDDIVVVIGEPNDAGQIEAQLIRVMPPMPQDNSANMPTNMQNQRLNTISN